MKKILAAYVFVACTALTLAACNERADGLTYEQGRIKEMNDKLPKGCTFHDLGEYRSDRIYMVRCDNSITTTSWEHSYQSGKTTTHKHYALTVKDD
jgi:hypothetical protein